MQLKRDSPWSMTEVVLQITGESEDCVINGAGTIAYPYGKWIHWINN